MRKKVGEQQGARNVKGKILLGGNEEWKRDLHRHEDIHTTLYLRSDYDVCSTSGISNALWRHRKERNPC